MKYTHVLFLSLILFSCSGDVFTQSDIQVVEAFTEAIEEKNFAVLDSLTKDDFILVGPAIGDTISKKQFIDNWKANTANYIKSIEFEHSQLSGLSIPTDTLFGNWIGKWSVARINYQADSLTPVTLLLSNAFLVVEGKLSKGVLIYDRADMYDQQDYFFGNLEDQLSVGKLIKDKR
ncbi:nuclear transport factor 2 family protein [Reichenbachiella ulvae]|uniref:Nuclear transport factor 2 family protein n=1 Tax=Reichenbachiella ulvae TaxID=2980104 RepID=A0ABT3CU33_9BACT|nr:nuclear transport factor 2 family protein [Reichenbachiella ulvae]MCV9387215.1 nuclear transport factor 2 family protein [Reichenbachiella ulvae]